MNQPIRILYAEGDSQAAERACAHFARHAPSFALQIVATGAACLEQVQRNPPDLLLLDYLLSSSENGNGNDNDSNGMELIAALLRQAPGLLVVMVTDGDHRQIERVVSALHSGAIHYLPKLDNYLAFLPELLHNLLAEHRRKQSFGLAHPEPLRILYVDSAPTAPAKIALILQHLAQMAPSFSVDVVLSHAEAMVRLIRPPAYDLAIINLRMAGWDGLDFLRSTRYRGGTFPPFIMLTDGAGESIALAALKLGAAEYIVKHEGWHKQLVVRIESAVSKRRLHRLNGQLQQNQSNVEQQVLYMEKNELEVQNEALRATQVVNDLALARNLDLYERAPVGYCTLNQAGLIVESNLMLASLLGAVREALHNQPFTRFIFREDQDLFYFLKLSLRNDHAQGLKEPHPQSCELRIVRADGSFFNSLLTVSSISNDGGVAGLRMVLADISQRRLIEVALQEAESRLGYALNASHTGTWSLNLTTHIASHSLMHDRIFGYDEPVPEWTYSKFLSHVLPEDLPEVTNLFAQAMETGSDWNFECRIRRVDGEVRWIWAYGGHQTDNLGAIRYMSGVVQDVTQRKQAELALQASVNEKTALLNEVHHRVKNNLQVISSLLRLERGRCAEQETKSLLSDMQGRIQAMGLLHETLYRSGTFATVDLATYVKQLATQSFRSLQTEHGKVRLEFDVVATKVGMDQATPCGLLLNELISNALKHGFPDGRGGEVRITLTPVDGGPQVRMCVSDTGVGLPADFETRRGMSLGLQLVSNLAKQLGGTLEIGPGTVFTVTFRVEESRLARRSA